MADENRKEQANVRSFRVTDEVMAQFRKIQDEMRLTQDETLKMFISAYEMEQAKNAIPDRETEISNFQMKANELVDAFLHSLQLNQDAEARIRAEVALQLKSKDEQIIDLQARVELKEQMAKEANAAYTEEENKRKQAEQAAKEAAEKMKIAQDAAKDKESISSMLAGKLAEAEKKASGYDSLKASELDYKEKLQEALQEVKDIRKDAEIERERAAASAEINTRKALAALEKEKNAEIQRLRDKIDALNDERSALKDTIAALREEIAGMKVVR